MINQKSLMKKMNKEVKQLENKIHNRHLYNVRNIVVKALIKSGIAIDYALPFIVASMLVANFGMFEKNAPFKADMVTESANVQTIDTSNGVHNEYTSYDFQYNEESIEYSTGWIINERGLYERTVTSYQINNSVDLSDTEKVLAMTKEEVENALEITNIRTIKKNTLSPEDALYDEDALIVVHHHKSPTLSYERPENFGENFANSALFLFLSLCWGYNFRNIGKVFIKNRIRDRLKGIESSFRLISNSELAEMQKILAIHKQNLALLTPSSDEEENRGYAYQLRKA